MEDGTKGFSGQEETQWCVIEAKGVSRRQFLRMAGIAGATVGFGAGLGGRAAELEYYQKHAPRLVEEPPASTFLQPASLARPEFLGEFDVTAVINRG